MTTFKTFLQESINDKGIFKAIFVLGIPGAGKSYTIKSLGGTISPRIVNTDRASEYLSNQIGRAINSDTWSDFKDRSLHLTKKSLLNYINGVLPLFVDGTSNDASNILQRMGILESLGYDIGIIHVKADLDIAINRARKRAKEIGRHVDEEFISDVYSRNEQNIKFLRNRVSRSSFYEVDNSNMELTNASLNKAYKKSKEFFSSSLKNPIGRRHVELMREHNQKYLSPEIVPLEVLEKKIEGWYK